MAMTITAQTAQQFFEGGQARDLAQTPVLRMVGGVVEFVLAGENGGTWCLDLDQGEVRPGSAKRPSCVIRATAQDFLALVAGNLSVADGMVSQRLRVTGDNARLVRVFQALSQLKRTDGSRP